MKTCDWCGRENADDALCCHECGTASFKDVEPATKVPSRTQRSKPAAASQPELEAFPTAQVPDYSQHMPSIDGFCRPRWDAIGEAIERDLPEPEWSAAWEAASRQWVQRLCDQLGGEYRVFETPNFLTLTEAPERVGRDACRSYEAALKGICDRLEGVALDVGYGKHVVLMFGTLDEYYKYISYFCREGEHPMSGGVCLSGGGYLHFAFPTIDFSSYRMVLVHELTHGCLAHLPLPSWINEALAMRMEQVICDSDSYPLEQEDFDEHRDYWNADSIQQFWSGESWHIPGEGFKLSYSLARLLWRKLEVDLSASREAILDFVGTASAEDGGEAACKSCLGVSLADLAKDLLGNGDWAPKPQQWPKPPDDSTRTPITGTATLTDFCLPPYALMAWLVSSPQPRSCRA